MRRTAKTVRDRRQGELFEPPPCDDALRGYYAKMRRHGMTLSINPETGRITVSRASGPIGAWAASPPSELRDRIVNDLMGAEHGSSRRSSGRRWMAARNWCGCRCGAIRRWIRR